MIEWNEHYLRGELPWDTNEPEPHLMETVRSGVIEPGRALEVGCGTGTNAIWLASQGFDVLGVDVAPRAVEMARTKARGAGGITFTHADFLEANAVAGTFSFVFDRGTFHVFDEPETRARFAERVAAVLEPGGRWLSIIGSTEGPPREEGPPRRSALDIVTAIEPVLEIDSLRTSVFHGDISDLRAWVCLSRRRTIDAQPSTRRG